MSYYLTLMYHPYKNFFDITIAHGRAGISPGEIAPKRPLIPTDIANIYRLSYWKNEAWWRLDPKELLEGNELPDQLEKGLATAQGRIEALTGEVLDLFDAEALPLFQRILHYKRQNSGQ